MCPIEAAAAFTVASKAIGCTTSALLERRSWLVSRAGLTCVCLVCPPALLIRFQGLLDDAGFAIELAELESDSAGAAASAESELASLLRQARAPLQQLSSGLDKWELRMLLAGPYDEAGALLTITAGAGNQARQDINHSLRS